MALFSGMTIESLWNDFERRACGYSYIKDRAGDEHRRLLNWVGSIDQSGYIREKCLRHLIENRIAGDENRILLRLSDWVDPVRSIACEWVAAHFKDLPPESIKANQRLILYLSRKEKVRELEAMRIIENDLLRRAEEMDYQAFQAFDAPFRRYLLRLSLRRGRNLRDWVLADTEPFNRLLLLERATDADLSPDEILAYSRDRSVHVRRHFSVWMIERWGRPSREFLMGMAFDSNLGIRQFARFCLMRFHEVDAYPIYRSRADKGFYHIADYAREEDADLFVEGCRHPSQRVRADCLRALISAAPNRLGELDLGGLIRSNRLTRQLVCAPSTTRLLGIDQIMALKADIHAASANGTLVFLRMLETKSYWVFLDAGLACLEHDPPPHVRQFIKRRALARVSINEKLSDSLRERITAALARLGKPGPARDEGFIEQIAFILKHA